MLNFKPHSNIQRLRLENQKKLDKIDKTINQSNHTKCQGFKVLFGGGIQSGITACQSLIG